jgi:hypothetical protein
MVTDPFVAGAKTVDCRDWGKPVDGQANAMAAVKAMMRSIGIGG